MKIRKVSVAYLFYHKTKEFCSYLLQLYQPNKKKKTLFIHSHIHRITK